MAQAQLKWTSNDGGTVKTFIIEGMLSLDRSKDQSSLDLPFPLIDDEGMLINSIFGQKRIFNGSFILMQRTGDDYTGGTGTPSSYSPEEQENWLLDDIFAPSGFHTLINQNGTEFNGRIEKISIVELGDDPLKNDVAFTFKRGLVPVAGQFSPF